MVLQPVGSTKSVGRGGRRGGRSCPGAQPKGVNGSSQLRQVCQPHAGLEAGADDDLRCRGMYWHQGASQTGLTAHTHLETALTNSIVSELLILLHTNALLSGASVAVKDQTMQASSTAVDGGWDRHQW